MISPSSKSISTSKGKVNDENHLDESIPKWFAIYTNYKREKIAAKYLSQQGITVYFPSYKVTRHYQRKVKEVELPLINQYLFVKITEREYVRVLQCPYVLHFIKFSRNLISIPEREISLIKRILGEKNFVKIGDTPLCKGDEVEVIGGCLTGLKGVFIKQENKQYLSIQLTNIGISLHVSVAVHLTRKTNSVNI